LLCDPWWQPVLYLALKRIIPQDLDNEMCSGVLVALMSMCGPQRFVNQLGRFVRYVSRTGDDGLLTSMLAILDRVPEFRSKNMVRAVMGPSGKSQSSLLIRASRRGHEFFLRLLLKYAEKQDWPLQSYVNLVSISQESALSIAADHGYAECVRALLEAGAEVDGCTKLGRPLDIACREGNLAVCQELVAAGSKYWVPGQDGRTPIEQARVHGHNAVATWLESLPGQAPDRHIASDTQPGSKQLVAEMRAHDPRDSSAKESGICDPPQEEAKDESNL